jgi:hypothetical protein
MNIIDSTHARKTIPFFLCSPILVVDSKSILPVEETNAALSLGDGINLVTLRNSYPRHFLFSNLSR